MIYIFEDFKLDTSRKLLFDELGEEKIKLTNKVYEVLELLVTNHGKLLTKDELMEAVWAEHFVEESNLTQTISMLRKTLGENPRQHRFIVTETGRGYRFVAKVNESSQDSFYEETISTNAQKTSYVSTEKVRSIAVLPFKSVNPETNDKLLGLGISDALITKISQTKSIIVRQINSIKNYVHIESNPIKIGREINVDTILEGTIQTIDQHIRVFVRLYDVNQNFLLWADGFDESETNIFALQDSIAEKVAESLSIELNLKTLNKLKHHYTENIRAYELYNKGRFFWNSRRSEDLQKSISFYKQAIAEDENYALAYACLAESYVLLHTFSPYQENDNFMKAKEASEKALELDENLAEPHTALAIFNEQYKYDWYGAEIEFLKAIYANPSYATAHQWYGEFLGFMNRIRESIKEVERAFELDPLSPSINTARAFPYLVSRQYEIAVKKLLLALKLDDKFPLAHYYLGRCYHELGNHKKAITHFEIAIEASGGSAYFKSALIRSFVKYGKISKAKEIFNEIYDNSNSQPISKYVLARGHAALGKKEKALELLEKAFLERDSLMVVMNVEPIFDEICDSEQFRKLHKQMNF